ncbi:MAG: hypothetical protein K2P88_14855 [Chitinophagaceae bacterium]|uniref:hypothetical protein n=1 Tax=unclassified Paraflavitalea TaxID=2798305 RepID=UPI003D32D3F5|nr:hypothetical protein [Chitinophagaceae bacterium]
MNTFYELGDIDSFESSYKNVILKNNSLIVPYVNLGLVHHDLNKSAKIRYLNFAYVVMEKIFFLDVFIEGKRYEVLNFSKPQTLYHLGGDYLDYGDKIYNDMSVSSEKSYIIPIEITKTSDSLWRSKELIGNSDFFDYRFFPNEIFESVGS